jgi:holo-[acyl-carrier protein] synthase
MIYGIGTDIFEVSRIKAVMEQDKGFLTDVFTEGEIAYCGEMKHMEQHYAVRFSAKEAFLKALGTGWRFGIKFTDIEIVNDELGKPHIRLYGKADEQVRKERISAIHVSLSHVKELATAIVILEKEA